MRGLPSGRANLVIWLLALVVISVLAHRFFDKVIVKDGTLTVAQSKRVGTVIFRWEGEIAPPMYREIAKAYDTWRYKANHIILSLSSGGGSLRHGDHVIELLRRIRKTHRLDTVVDRSSACASMCVPIYLQGQMRYAAPASRWMFHEVRILDSLSQKEVDDKRAKHRYTNLFFEKYFLPAKVSWRWLSDVRRRIVGRDYWRSGDDLVREHSGIVHRLVRRSGDIAALAYSRSLKGSVVRDRVTSQVDSQPRI